MSQRKPAKPVYAFHRFLEGIFSYFLDRGMTQEKAKLRMYKETYDVVFDFAKKEKDIPDHVLVSTMQHASRHLNQRGASISKLARESDQVDEDVRKALQEIKEAKDSIDAFIRTYRGES